MYCCLVHAASAAAVATSGARANREAIAQSLDAIARACSPRVMSQAVGSVGSVASIFDASGLTRVLGPPHEIAREVSRMATERGLTVHVAVSSTMTSAWVLAHAVPGCTVVPSGDEAMRLAPLPLSVLVLLPEFQRAERQHENARGARRAGARGGQSAGRGRRHYRLAPGPSDPRTAGPSDPRTLGPSALRTLGPSDPRPCLAILGKWGLRTLGDLAALPRAEVRTRLGAVGVRLHQAAHGEDADVLVPESEPVPFRERLALDWPVDGLEPLSFVVARLCESLSAALQRADRGAVDVSTSLWLVTREWHRRTLHLPGPMRDARVLRTLIMLDLESHPAPAAVDVVEIETAVTPGRIVQGALLERTLPSQEDLTTLIARLGALMGETRVGAPAAVDTHDDRAVAMTPFRPAPALDRLEGVSTARGPVTGFRRFRIPLSAHVDATRGVPTRVRPARGFPGGVVVSAAGPWRSSGAWWTLGQAHWDRDEWDVELAGSGVCRLSRDRVTGRWVVEGVVD